MCIVNSVEASPHHTGLFYQLQRVEAGAMVVSYLWSGYTVGVYFSGVVAGDELHCLPGGSRINGKWAANIHDGSTPGGKAIIRCITTNPATGYFVKSSPRIREMSWKSKSGLHEVVYTARMNANKCI